MKREISNDIENDDDRNNISKIKKYSDRGEKIGELVSSDSRIGFPLKKPNIEKNPHGWFWASHTDVIATVAGSHTRKTSFIHLFLISYVIM